MNQQFFDTDGRELPEGLNRLTNLLANELAEIESRISGPGAVRAMCVIAINLCIARIAKAENWKHAADEQACNEVLKILRKYRDFGDDDTDTADIGLVP